MFPGTEPIGDADALIRKYSYAGEELWTVRSGTPCREVLSGVEAFGGALFVSGTTSGDVTVPPLPRCTNPPVPQRNFSAGLATYVQRMTGEGALVWSQQYGADSAGVVGFTLAIALAADASGVYVASEAVRDRRDGFSEEPGAPTCASKSPREDVLVQQLGLDGSLGASVRFGSPGTDVPSGIAVGSDGVHVGGSTACTVLGGTSQGGFDAFVVGLE